MSQTFGELLALLVSLCGALSSVLYDKLGKRSSADLLALVRMVIAAPVMVCIALAFDGFILRDCSSRDLALLAVSGVLGFFLTDLFMFRSYVIWGARETMVVMCLSPILSGLLAFALFGESLSARQIAGSLLSVVGITVMTLDCRSSISKEQKRNDNRKSERQRMSFAGVAGFAFLAAMLQSIADLTAKSALDQMPWKTSSSIRAVAGLSAWIVFAFIMKDRIFEKINVFKDIKFSLTMLVNILIGTVLATTVAMGALKYAPTGIVTCLKQISPVMILPYELLSKSKRLTVLSFMGTVLSVVGVVLVF